ncbi:MAG: response regulator transcription factor [Duodenibacillus sp.]|nr:response regulator transcription factor [Duodenibacillus sp.]
MFQQPPRILIIDDDVELVTLLVDYLQLESFETQPAGNGAEGLAKLGQGRFDLVILDVMMPGMSGQEVLQRIRAMDGPAANVPVIMLTARGDPVDRILGLELGADDYVPKPCPPRELVARIRAILRRSRAQENASDVIVAGPLTVDPVRRRVSVGGSPVTLTSTELTLLEVLARQAGQPVAKADIYPRVLGRPMGRFDRSIDVHVSSVRRKLQEASSGRIAIESIRGIGYQLVVDAAGRD